MDVSHIYTYLHIRRLFPRIPVVTMDAMADLKRSLFPDEEILGIVFGDWLDFSRPKYSGAEAMRTGVLLSVEEAGPMMRGWEFYNSDSKCYSMYAWTQGRVLFVSEYDGSTMINSCPRNPCAMIPKVYGANCDLFSREMFVESGSDEDREDCEEPVGRLSESEERVKEEEKEEEEKEEEEDDQNSDPPLDAYEDLKNYMRYKSEEQSELVFSPHIEAIVFGNRMDSGPLRKMASHDNGHKPYTCRHSRWGKSIGVPNDLKGVILSEEQARPHMKGWTYRSDYGAGEKCFATLVWTPTHVIWAVQNDERTTLRSAPRNPCHTQPATSFA